MKEEDSFEIINRKKIFDKVLIITEGKTDWKHLKKALERFWKSSIYLDLNIKFNEYEETDMGDAELDSMVRTYSKNEQFPRHIFLFDRDNKKYVQKYGIEAYLSTQLNLTPHHSPNLLFKFK